MTYTLTKLLKILIIVLLPIAILAGSIRLLATTQYLTYEYGKPVFPADPFGFTKAQRFDHAAATIRYVRDSLPVSTLEVLQHYGTPLYNQRELKHMIDVQIVYQYAWLIGKIAIGLLLLVGALLFFDKRTRTVLASGLRIGGVFTAGLVAVIGLSAIFAWQAWFVAFHEIFFAQGSWTFNFTDTLIRLFPEKFWFDAATTIAGLSMAAGLAAVVLSLLLKSRKEYIHG